MEMLHGCSGVWCAHTRHRQALEGLPYRIGHGPAGALGLDAAQTGFVVQEVMAQGIRELLLSLAGDPDNAPGL